jgi:hypothetical protein
LGHERLSIYANPNAPYGASERRVQNDNPREKGSLGANALYNHKPVSPVLVKNQGVNNHAGWIGQDNMPCCAATYLQAKSLKCKHYRENGLIEPVATPI